MRLWCMGTLDPFGKTDAVQAAEEITTAPIVIYRTAGLAQHHRNVMHGPGGMLFEFGTTNPQANHGISVGQASPQ